MSMRPWWQQNNDAIRQERSIAVREGIQLMREQHRETIAALIVLEMLLAFLRAP